METFVFYDVPDDRLRSKVMGACRDFGLRWLQYSGFRGSLPQARREELAARMRLLIGKRTGFVVIVPVCERDSGSSRLAATRRWEPVRRHSGATVTSFEHCGPCAMNSRLLLAVSDLQALSFCRRSAYFRVRLGLRPPPTPRMLEGKAVERRTTQLEKRRTPARHDAGDARRTFAVRVISHRLGLSGIVDEVLETPSGLIPVEIKSGINGGLAAHRDQVLAYAAALEESRGVPIPLGFLVYVRPGSDEATVHLVHNTPSRRRRVERLAAELHRISASDALPAPTADRSRCRHCDFRRYCDDVAL